jgi:hypothetical protein
MPEAPRDVAAPDEADRSRPIGRRRGFRPAPAAERVLSETSTQIGAIRQAASPTGRVVSAMQATLSGHTVKATR